MLRPQGVGRRNGREACQVVKEMTLDCELSAKVGRCQVEEIHRQMPADYRAGIMQMATGDVRAGLEELDRLDWIKECRSNYLEHAAADYLRLTHQGRNLDYCLAVSFTWEENHRFTESIRKGLKEGGVLPIEGTPVTVYESLRWTNHKNVTGGSMSRDTW
ncbi:MAG TPA: hypothetical protein VIT91_03830 [Chthoniobacterales bacterium]